MPFDRDGTLRKAEKLLRQGKLDLAIVEYRSVIEAEPNDWNTANTLGDLYFRAGQTDKAVAEYGRIADHLASEGFTSKAVALYRKILKIKPDEERSMWHLGQISARQGLLVDARAHFMSLVERRRARGDRRGELEARIRLGELDGADLETRLTGARAKAEIGNVAPAAEQLKAIATDLEEKGRHVDALAVLAEALSLTPDDADLKRVVMNAHVARGDFESAREHASGPAELKEVAEELFRLGRVEEGLGVLTAVAHADPADAEVRARIAKLHIARGDFEAARQYASTPAELKEVAEELFRIGRDEEGLGLLAAAAEADSADLAVRARIATLQIARGDFEGVKAVLTPEVAGTDADLLWTLAEIKLRDGRIPEGTAVLQQLLAADPQKRDALVILGCAVGEVNPDAGYECIEVAARAAIAQEEWGSAAAALNEFVHRVPNYIPALMRLVDVCVDGGLEATMHSAQAQLADAYLEMELGAEARVIAEDLVAREPWERSNIERFRRALTLLGEPDVDGMIADRLSGQSPFLTTDFNWPAETMPEPARAAKAGQPPPGPVEPAGDAAPSEGFDPAPVPAPVPVPVPAAGRKPAAAKLGAGFHAIDLSGFLGDVERHEAAAAPARAGGQEREVDLNEALHGMGADGDDAPKKAQSLESVLKGVRDGAVHEAASPEVAEQHFKLATTYIEMGMTAEAMAALEVSARSIRHRFRAGALLAKLLMEKGDIVQAVEWFERASEAPAPTPAAAHQLLYELATALEAQGERERALAVLLELQSEAGEYRDLAQRIENLMGS